MSPFSKVQMSPFEFGGGPLRCRPCRSRYRPVQKRARHAQERRQAAACVDHCDLDPDAGIFGAARRRGVARVGRFPVRRQSRCAVRAIDAVRRAFGLQSYRCAAILICINSPYTFAHLDTLERAQSIARLADRGFRAQMETRRAIKQDGMEAGSEQHQAEPCKSHRAPDGCARG